MTPVSKGCLLMRIQQYCFHNNGYKLAKIIQRQLGFHFTQNLEYDGIEFIHANGTRLLKLIDSTEKLIAHFYINVTKLSNNIILYKLENQEEHQENIWVYEGEAVSELEELTKVALRNFMLLNEQ